MAVQRFVKKGKCISIFIKITVSIELALQNAWLVFL